MKTDLRIISGILYRRRRKREERENMTTQSFKEVLEEEKEKLRQKDLRQHRMYQ